MKILLVGLLLVVSGRSSDQLNTKQENRGAVNNQHFTLDATAVSNLDADQRNDLGSATNQTTSGKQEFSSEVMKTLERELVAAGLEEGKVLEMLLRIAEEAMRVGYGQDYLEFVENELDALELSEEKLQGIKLEVLRVLNQDLLERIDKQYDLRKPAGYQERQSVEIPQENEGLRSAQTVPIDPIAVVDVYPPPTPDTPQVNWWLVGGLTVVLLVCVVARMFKLHQ